MLSSGAAIFSATLSFVLCQAVSAAPQVNIGQTILIGRDIAGLKQDFFGGKDDVLPWKT